MFQDHVSSIKIMNHLNEKEQKRQDNLNATAQLFVGIFMTTIGAILFYVLANDARIDTIGFTALLILCLTLCVVGCIIAFDALNFLLQKRI